MGHWANTIHNKKQNNCKFSEQWKKVIDINHVILEKVKINENWFKKITEELIPVFEAAGLES